MPVSTVTYTANGSTNQFSITFPYIDAAHVLVSVNDASASFTFHNSTTVHLSSTPTSGQTVVVYRQTPSSALVDFTDGSTLFESDLDLANTQARYLSEEARDRADSAITTVTANKANIDTVAGITGDVTTVAGISANVTTVAGDTAEIAAVAGKTTEISALSTSANIANMVTLGASGVVADIATVAGVAPTMTAAASNATNAAASATAAANSAAAAATALDSFDDRYLGAKSSEPSVDNDGNALVSGALFFDSTAGSMKVYDGSDWVAATSSGAVSLLEYEYTATSGQTTFTGADNNSATLSYSAGNIIVSLNGITLDNGSDYTSVSGTSIVLASGAAAGDHLAIVAFKSFNVADAVSATTGGTFGGGLTVAGNVSLPDNYKAIFGTGSDLQVYHTGSVSVISEQGTGDLNVQTNGANIALLGNGGSEYMANFASDGAVTLYHNNAAKIATTASGISVTGTVAATAFTGDGSGLTGLGGGVPAGSVIYHAANTAPTGFLKADGAAVSRSTYSDLFTAIGTTFGVGDGSSTFNVPDLRGEFPRGWDDSRGVDSGRSFGSAQTDAMQGHRHNTTLNGNYFKNDGGVGPGPNAWTDQPSGGQTKTGDPTTDGSNGTPRTAAETRPRNIALLACIKY